MLIQRYATPHTIWPIASVIMTKPIPLPRRASAAKSAAAARPVMAMATTRVASTVQKRR